MKKVFYLALTACVLLSGNLLAAAQEEEQKFPATIFGDAEVYDYEQSTQSGLEYFSFGQTAYNTDNYHNSWRKEDDFLIKSGLVRDTLDENGNVILSDYTKKVGSGKKAQVISAPRTVPLSSAKSGKLFDDRERIGNFKFPFVHIGEGYYEYDSSKNNALVNLTTNVLDLTKPFGVSNGAETRPGFMPLSNDGKVNYYFGVTTALPFVIPESGKANGKDMVFEFSGDDDVWVFVDGKLALDLGGIHNVVSGSINFTTGEVITSGKTSEITSLQKLGIDASGKEHILKVFYLERGAGFSNCKMKFNLVQPTNYIIKYYDGDLSEGSCFDSIVKSSRENGEKLYEGDKILLSEIRVDEKLDQLGNRELYYGGFVVDDNAMAMQDPEAVVTTVTEDNQDVVKVLYIRKPGYKVTYWKAASEDGAWTKIDHVIVTDGLKIGDEIKVEDINKNLKKPQEEGVYYYNGKIMTADAGGVLGVINDKAPVNIDVLYLETSKENAEEENKPVEPPVVNPDYSTDLIPDNAVQGPNIVGELRNDNAYIYGYTDTIMAPENPVKRSEASAMLNRLLKQNDKRHGFTAPSNPSFHDLDGNEWYYTALEFMEYIGVYNPAGGKNLIAADTEITRGEAAKLFAFALGLEKTENVCGFDDLNQNNKYYQYINALVAAGYIQGDSEANTVRPNDLITRAEYVKIYNKIIGRGDQYDIHMDVEGKPVVCQFVDLNEEEWYYADMVRATNSFTDYKVDLSKRENRNELDDYRN